MSCVGALRWGSGGRVELPLSDLAQISNNCYEAGTVLLDVRDSAAILVGSYVASRSRCTNGFEFNIASFHNTMRLSSPRC